MINFSNKIRRARIEAKISQLELGEILQITRAQIANYESGKSMPSAEMLYNIAKALNKPIAYFYEEEPQTIYNETINSIDLILEKQKTLISELRNLKSELVNNFIFDNELSKPSKQRVAKKQFRKD